jgi:hypothetical protein
MVRGNSGLVPELGVPVNLLLPGYYVAFSRSFPIFFYP